MGRWVARGEGDAIILVGLLLAWNEHNKPPMGAAEGDPDPVLWALEKVHSVLRMEAEKRD